LAICLVAVALPATSSWAATLSRVDLAAVPRYPTHTERWVTLDDVRGVGRIDWTCEAGSARTRFVNSGPTSSRVRAFVGSAQLWIEAILHPRLAIEMPLGRRVQRWRVRPISESLPEPVNFRVHPLRAPCARPAVSHDVGRAF